MFGQAPAPSPFGTPGTTPGGNTLFGAPAPAFGSPAPAPAFGAPAATPSTGGFGFGSPAPAPSTGFGGFGSNTPAPAPTGFGAFGAPAPAPAFGAPAPTTPFGAPAPAPSGGLFGSTPAPAPSGGLFGSGSTSGGFGSTPAPATAFGAPATTPAFGAPAPTSAFGAPAPAPSAFGTTSTFGSSPAPATGLFGAPAPAPTNAFGAPAAPAFGAPAPSGGLFGGPKPTPAAGGLFGAPAPATGGKPGSLQVPYSDSRINDGATSMNFKSISAMSVYDKKSFEELRIEDYMSGNKGVQGQNIGTTAFGAPASTFGSPAPASSGIFGAPAPTTSTFGAPATSTFGSAPATTFGSPAAAAPSAFGAPAPSGGLFGAPTPAATTFGSPATSTFGAPAPAPSGGLFGAPAPAPSGGLFGAPVPAPSGGLFGAPAPAPSGGLFGATAPAPSGGLFGAPAPAPSGGLFGAPAPAPAGGLFGAPAPAPAAGSFGAPAPAPTGGLFGAPATGGLFGAPAPAPSGGLFGAPAPAPTGGLFGAPAPAPTGGLFGAPAPKPAGGLFGSPAPAGGLFGAPAPAPAFGAAPSTTSVFGTTTPGATTPIATSVLVPPSADSLLAHQLAAVETQKKEMAVLEALRGGSSPGSRSTSSSGSVIPTSIFQRDAAAIRYRGLAGGGSSQSSYPSQIAPRSTAKVRPRGFGPPTPSPVLQLGSSQAKTKPITPSAFIASGTKHLVIKPGSLTPKPRMRLLLSDDTSGQLENKGNKGSHSPSTDGVIRGSAIENEKSKTPVGRNEEMSSSKIEKPTPFDVSKIANDEAAFTSPEAVSKEITKSTSGKKKKTPTANGEAYDYYRTVIGSPQTQEEIIENESTSAKSCVPKLSMEGYVVTPSISQLSNMNEAELATVSNFVVEKVGVGSVAWDGAVDVRGVDLDSIISIENKDVAVYHKQEELGTKPPEGTKLNRSAVITFHGVYPKGGPGSSEEIKKKFDKKLQKHAKNMGAEFIMYDGDTGIWMFRVPHFSRYALVDDSDDENDEELSSNKDFESGVGGGSTQINIEERKTEKKTKLSHIRVPMNEDEEMVEYQSDNLIDHTAMGKNEVLQAAEAAYLKMANVPSVTNLSTPKRSMYAVEGHTVSDYNMDNPIQFPATSQECSYSISDKIARQCGINVEKSSSIDFSRRLGKSFRVGWKPDGSFFFTKQRIKVAKSRPITGSDNSSLNLLLVHLENSVPIDSGDNTPIFSIHSTVNSGEKNNKKRCLSNITKKYTKVCEALSLQENSSHEIATITRAFALIRILFLGNSRNEYISSDFSRWLKDISQSRGKANISSDPLMSIFDALSCGSVREASLLARKEGFISLSSIIANTSVQSNSALETQIKSWMKFGSEQFIPLNLYRIYAFMSGDLSLEESIYEKSGSSSEHALNWKRRLTMLDKCQIACTSHKEESKISTVIQKYDLDVEEGKAPPPNAWYFDPRNLGQSTDEKTKHTCVLYRLLRLYCNENMGLDGDVELSDIISPLGYTPYFHKVSFSFHLASILSTLQLRSCIALSESEECKLLETYASSLVSDGYWEWAIYVILCTFNSNEISKKAIKWRKVMAIDIISRHFNESSSDSQERREFLETKLAIPKEWFEKARTYRSMETSRNLQTRDSTCDPIQDMSGLPAWFFDADRIECDALISTLQEIEAKHFSLTNFGTLLLEYLKLTQIVIHISYETLQSSDINFDELIIRAEGIASAISEEKMKSGIGIDVSDIPRSVAVAEFTSATKNLIVQLNVLKAGGSVFERSNVYEKAEQKVLKIMSKLGYELAKKEKLPSTANETDSSSYLRGKCGIQVNMS